MVLSTPKPSDDDALAANREVPHLTLDGENSIVMEYVAPGWGTSHENSSSAI